jgi:hypothetical protein
MGHSGAAHHFSNGPLVGRVGGNLGPGSGRHSSGARSMIPGWVRPRPAAKTRRHPASSQRRDSGNNTTRPSTVVTKPGMKRRIPPRPGAIPRRSNGAAAIPRAPAARSRVTSPLKCRRTNSPAKDISNSSRTAFTKPTAAETHTNATISTAGHASNPMAINLIRRIAPNPFDRGPRSRAIADIAVRQCGDIVLACTSRWSKLPLHTKARLGWQKLETWNRIADSPI